PQIGALGSRVPMPSDNVAGRTSAGYRLLERVCEGGTAEVYRAQHAERGACAFKVLRSGLRSDPTAIKRFLREAGYGARVQHPGVVRTYDYGETEGLHYLALEWADGKSLAEYVHRTGPLAPALVADLVGQLAAALAAASLSGELGDGRAAIYMLATITSWLLTGRHPYAGKTPRELFQQLLTEPPLPLNKAVPGRRFPAGLEAAVMRGLERDPGRRQPTVAAFAEAVTAGSAAPPAPSGGGLIEALKRVVRRRE